MNLNLESLRMMIVRLLPTVFRSFCVVTALWAMTARSAEQVNLRVATVAPPGTSFHQHLEDLGQLWAKAPGAQIKLNSFPGTQGGEPQIVRRMRVNQLQGAMLTAIGLAQIDESVTALQLMPAEFKSWEEVDHVRTALEPQLEELFLKQGYVVLFWADAGWVRFFASRPVNSIHDIKGMRIFASTGMPKTLELMREYYTPVELDPDKILLSLRNGMIDGVPIPPFLANFAQVTTRADYMLDLKWAPVVGAMVVTKRFWDQLPPETQAYVMETSRQAGEQIRTDSRREDDEAIQAMVEKQGLKVTSLSPEAYREWMAEVDKVSPRIRGNIIPADMFDRVKATLKEYRETQGSPAAN